MSQTIHKLNNNNSVDIYYHPNGATGKITDKKAQYRYTVMATKFTKEDFLQYVDGLYETNDEGTKVIPLEYIKPIIKAFIKTKNKYIWQLYSHRGNKVNIKNEFHANLKDVKSAFYTF